MSLNANPMAIELIPKPAIMLPGLNDGITIVAAVKSPSTQTTITLNRDNARTSGPLMCDRVPADPTPRPTRNATSQTNSRNTAHIRILGSSARSHSSSTP